METIKQPERAIPVVDDVDIVVVGGELYRRLRRGASGSTGHACRHCREAELFWRYGNGRIGQYLA